LFQKKKERMTFVLSNREPWYGGRSILSLAQSPKRLYTISDWGSFIPFKRGGARLLKQVTLLRKGCISYSLSQEEKKK
jgi:hypothetical protein